MRLAHAVLSGKARQSGMSKGYAQEVVQKMHGRSMKALPEHAGTRRVKRARRVR